MLLVLYLVLLEWLILRLNLQILSRDSETNRNLSVGGNLYDI